MVPKFGLVCITASKAVRYKTITRKRLLQFDLSEQERLLRDLYAENLRRLGAAVHFCIDTQIQLYRLGSGTFPFSDDEMGAAILDEFVEELKLVGEVAMREGVRLVLHPDQFVVLNSDRPEVIENSLKILRMHAHTFDLMGLPRSTWALMNIHGGKGDRADRLINTIQELPDNIRSRITLENDEYTYGVDQILPICQATGIPLVFDAHHHIIHEHLESYEDPSVIRGFEAARETWSDLDLQLVHISNGAETFADQHHSDYITVMPSCYRNAPWIEIEAKQKEFAIKKLQEEWLYSNVNVLSPVITESEQPSEPEIDLATVTP
jgi:UV DNA damage endonuclease